MNRRAQIRMTDEEVLAFLDEPRTIICATNGPRGWPHLMPLWYALRDGQVWVTTYAKSQKVRNIERDARATLQAEAGESYDELHGVMLECDVVVHRDTQLVAELMHEVHERYAGGPVHDIEGQAPKRVALQFVERRRASWDHRKLGGDH